MDVRSPINSHVSLLASPLLHGCWHFRKLSVSYTDDNSMVGAASEDLSPFRNTASRRRRLSRTYSRKRLLSWPCRGRPLRTLCSEKIKPFWPAFIHQKWSNSSSPNTSFSYSWIHNWELTLETGWEHLRWCRPETQANKVIQHRTGETSNVYSSTI